MSTADRLAISAETKFYQQLIRLPRDIQTKVARALAELQRNPTHNSKPLAAISEDVWRCRIGAYRILFARGPGWLHLFSVRHRSSVYTGSSLTPKQVPSMPRPDMPKEPEELPQAEPLVDAIEESSPLSELELRKQGISEELIEGVRECRTREDVLSLIDLGLPDHLFEALVALVDDESPRREDRSRYLELVSRNVIDHFFGRVVRLPPDRGVLDITLVSPWITPWDGRHSSLRAVIKFLRANKSRATIITRPPDSEAHRAAIESLTSLQGVEIVTLAQLHAKFFICDVAPAPFCLVGSANATANSLNNFEVGVMVRGVGQAEGFIRDLQSLTIELRAQGKRIKRRHR